MKQPIVFVIIPALNEEQSISKVLHAIPNDLVDRIFVIDNGSTDNTIKEATKSGAVVLSELEKGYGAACLKGMDHIGKGERIPDVIVFIDGDYSDYPEEMSTLIQPIVNNEVDFVIGSRAIGSTEKGSMTFPQKFGNRLATFLMRIIFNASFTDLGPFRAISYSKLLDLKMKDRNYGWTIEMQIKAVKNGLRYMEVPVSYRRRIGKSKVSGTLNGAFKAGYKILLTIGKYI